MAVKPGPFAAQSCVRSRYTDGRRLLMEDVLTENCVDFSASNELNGVLRRPDRNGKLAATHLDAFRFKTDATTHQSMFQTSCSSTQTSNSQFYCSTVDASADDSQFTGSSNLLVQHGLEHAYQKFFGKKTKESLSTFLTHLPGLIDVPGTQNDSLQSLINKPPIGGKELIPLSGHQLAGFRLNPGAVPEQFKFVNQQPTKKKHKHKKHKREHGESKVDEKAKTQEGPVEKKQKKSKKHTEDGEKKKKKKEKKKKKRQSPDPNQTNGKT